MKNHKKIHNHQKVTDRIFDQYSGLYAEHYFQEVLSLERKRTERSGKLFVLALLDFNNLLRNNGDHNLLMKIVHSIYESTREIDVKGWYRKDSIIGIIFTEINGTNKDMIREKISRTVSRHLNYIQKEMITITVHFFPEDGSNKNQNKAESGHLFPEECDQKKPDKTEVDLRLYPDIRKKNISKIIALILKRLLDIGGSIFCIVLFSPFFLIIPIMIKLTSKGPVIFKQERMGKLGRKFDFFKFRTMYIHCDDTVHREYIKDLICSGKAVEVEENDGSTCKTFKLINDSRITPIGTFLRRTSLDELPQFFNVLKGDMSLVGPRPPIPYELDNYDIWHRRRILETRPGITGIWQVYGRSLTTFDEMVRMDIQYIRKRSLYLDAKLLLLTPWAVVKGKGAY